MKHKIEILQSDRKNDVEEKLFKIFSNVFENLERNKFQLYSAKDINTYSEINFEYNIHYNPFSIIFTNVAGKKYWMIECQSFSEKSLDKETKYWRTGLYLYSNKNGNVCPFKSTIHLDNSILEDDEFTINEDGTSNYEALYEKKEKEREEKEDINEVEYLEDDDFSLQEKIYCINKSCHLEFKIEWFLEKEKLEEALKRIFEKNEIIKEIKIDDEDFGYYSHKYTYKVDMEVFFDINDCYPKDRAETKIKEITDLCDKYFDNELHYKTFDTKTFNDEKALYEFLEKKKKGQKNLKEMLSKIDEKINIERQEKNKINILELQLENERKNLKDLKTEIINRLEVIIYKIDDEINAWKEELMDYRNSLVKEITENEMTESINPFLGGRNEKNYFQR